MKNEELQEQYILDALQEVNMAGDAYTSVDDLYQLCKRSRRSLSTDAFLTDKAFLQREGLICQEGRRVYQAKSLQYENEAAKLLAGILAANDLRAASVDTNMPSETAYLTGEQWAAADMVFSHRLSLILGGAGTGKTTLVQALILQRPQHMPGCVLCAPTGKAARNLTERTGFPARTVHGVLGLHPDEDFLTPVSWPNTGLVVVDEASMMTLEMLAGILHVVSPLTHVVLVGDPNQLLSVGAGNVLPDLLALGVPYTRLTICHRQSADATALVRNVQHFKDCRSLSDLCYDNSFYFVPQADDRVIRQAVCIGGAKLYGMGASIQVLSPYRQTGHLSVSALNRDLREQLNPPTEQNQNPNWPDAFFREGDRVIVLKNDWEQGICNGDIGRFSFIQKDSAPVYGIHCGSRNAVWYGKYPQSCLDLAYAITVHKAQGSEYDIVILPLSHQFASMLNRHLLYTAISRARKHVILIGDPDALAAALQREARPRKSMLVTKTRMAQLYCA